MSTALARIREIVPAGEFVVLDTETTGIDYRAEIVQIGIVSAKGEILADSFVRPTIPIPSDALAIHGITDAMVADAPTIGEIGDTIRAAIKGRPVIVYNAEYDMRLLDQSSRARGVAGDWRSAAPRWICAMLAYAEHRGVPGRRYGEFRWHKLGDAARHERIEVTAAHAAVGDCLTTLALVRKLSAIE
ncbi:MAG: 3'-5' exonuclease [Armatimonadetes bacterium]|nr:3'-5' exonuclease [Armatimonadota bacterium]